MDVGQQSQLVITNWRVEQVTYNTKTQPKLLMTVVSCNGTPTNKEWQTGNRGLIMQLYPLFENAQRLNQGHVSVLVTNMAKNDYRVTQINAGAQA